VTQIGVSVQTMPAWPNVATMMFALAASWGTRPLARRFQDGTWQVTTWDDFGRRTAALARALRAAGISAGDRVVLVSENRPDFTIAEVALQAIRAIPVPAYVTNSLADHAHVITNSGARAAIVSTKTLAERVTKAAQLDLVICMEPGAASAIDWQATLQSQADFGDIAAEAALIPPGSLAVILYTSGTAGAPRGVMLSHRALLANCRSALALCRPLKLEREIYLSFLPMSHSFEHTLGQYFLPMMGSEIVFSRGIEHLAADMASVRPTLMTMVPRILEVIRARILSQAAREKPWRQRLFNAAIDIGRKRATGTPLALWERVADPVLDRVVRDRIRQRFGGRLRTAVSGSARLEPEVGRFFQALGIQLIQGYGQTEAGPVISAMRPDSRRIDTVGPPLDGVEVMIAEDGEILVHGDLLMEGYWGLPAETARTLQDGWLHTGDIGVIDPDGSLRITDRKKDIIVLSGGDKVSPARIEGLLVSYPAITQAVVSGEGKAGLSALVVPAEGFTDADAARAIASANATLSTTERIRHHVVVPAFTIENGLLTVSQKVRRHLVIATYAELLSGL
jgi:long-chain acyl-CoA synthetase